MADFRVFAANIIRPDPNSDIQEKAVIQAADTFDNTENLCPASPETRTAMMFQPLHDTHTLNPPSTVTEVVDILFRDLFLRDKVILASMSEHELESSVYLALAKTIRQEFGLYNGNHDLLDSCAALLGKEYDQHEDPAMVIVKELWKKIKETHKLHRVK